MAIANILDDTKDGDILAASYTKYRNHGSSVRHGAIRLRSIMLTALHAKQQLRASLDWERVRRLASEIVDELAYRTPELKHMVLKPGGPMKPHNVLPIGFSYRRRCPHKKQSRWPTSSVAKGYIRKRSRLLSSSCSQEPRDAMLDKAMSMVADAVDKSLKAGICPKLNQEHPLQPKGPAKNPGIPSVLNASATVAPIAETTFGTFPGTANITGMPSMANADKLTRHVLSSGVPFSRMMFGAPVSQTMSSSLITPAKTCRVSSISNAGATVAPVTLSMFGTNTMAGPARDLRMPSVANAGATVAPVTQAMFGTNTMAGPDRDPRMPSVANAGATVAPVTQAMFGTMAGSASDPRIPSVANAGELSSHVQSAGVPVSQAVFECLTNHAKNSLISLMRDAENSHQSNSARNNTREELNPDEQDLHPKCQWTTGAFVEADLAEYLEGPCEIGTEARDI
ncbi:uncharacterized protein [Miscanthus floridulus]|uniref:uncharacterized protein n=1 Tax=Miscanthus floridulus TaxID=154761 RepID=UPI0034586252